VGNFDPLRLRPPTVEELAAQERAEVKVDRPPLRGRHRRDRRRRGLLVALITVGLLVTGAGAFALARSGSEPEAAQPYGPDAPFGVSYVDGFGEHSPKPSPSSVSSRARPRVSVTTSVPSAMPTPSAVDSGGGNTLEAAPVTMSAVQWTMAFDGNYEAFVWVRNEGTKAAPWEVRVTLPAGATVTRTMSVDKRQSGGAFVFTSPAGDLAPGKVYLFGFSGAAADGRFSLRSCTVNGVACVPFR
jgi:hypothetical protein